MVLVRSAFFQRTAVHVVRELAVVVWLPLVVLWGTTYWGSAFFWTKQSQRELQQMAALGVKRLERLVKETEAAALGLIDEDRVLEAVRTKDRVLVQELLNAFLKSHAAIEHVVLVDEQGYLWMSAPYVGKPVHETPLLFVGSTERWPRVSHVALSWSATPQKTIGVTVPMLDQERIVGFVQLQYRVEQLEAWVSQVRSGEVGGFLYILDQEGNVVVHPYAVMSGQPMNIAAQFPAVRSMGLREAIQVLRDEHGHRHLLAVDTTSFGWRVVAQQSFKRMQAQARRTYFPVMVVSSVVVVLAALLGLWRGAGE